MSGRRTETLGGIAVGLGVFQVFGSICLLAAGKSLARLQGTTIRAAVVHARLSPVWYFSSIALLLGSGLVATVSGLGLYRGHDWCRRPLRWLMAVLLAFYGYGAVSAMFVLLYHRHHSKPLWFYVGSYFCSLAWEVGLFAFWLILGDVEVRTDVGEAPQPTA